ncbi:MAG: Replication-relaxation [Chloroflexota bacterium]|jgi:hypothetical protein
MLQRLNDSVLLAEDDLARLVWTEPVSRQARAERFTRWRADQYIEVSHSADGACVQLGRAGARVLREAGFPHVAPVRPIADRVRPGLLLANRLGVSLTEDIQTEPGIGGMAWVMRPFSGGAARDDGLAALLYDLDNLPAQRLAPDLYTPQLLDAQYTPPEGYAVQRFIVEIDRGTENPQQLRARATNWRSRWERTEWPPATHAVFLWITTEGWTRVEDIWRAWTQHALLPAFFTTVETLTLGTGGRWQPWNPRRVLPDGREVWVWRDLAGQPRSLRPWDLEESTLRFEPPRAVSLSNITSWNAV